jgi:2-dehydropantoate 2-reductase
LIRLRLQDGRGDGQESVEMKIFIVGSGAMGALYGGLLHRSGADVTLIDTWAEHVAAINRDGLHLEGISGDLRLPMKAVTTAAGSAVADVVFIQVNTYSTNVAAQTAKRILKESGYAITFQNGAGNVETLCEVLGRQRVVGGLSYHSAAVAGPGHVLHTHRGPTWLGELDGKPSARVQTLAGVLEKAALQPTIVEDIMSHIWTKFIHNSAINPV